MRIGKLLKIQRTIDGTGVRDAAKVFGISPATYSRIENDKPIDAATQLKLINWLFNDIAP